jgi:hypothetical protein
MSQLGRISGQLLKDNLTRNGHDLTFDKIVDADPLVAKDGLLHLDVTNRRVGINTETPEYDLDVDGTTRTTELEVTTQADIADLTFTTDTITSNTGILNLANGTGDQINYQAKLVVDNVELENNVISTNAGANLELRPDGTGTVDIYADTNVYGNVYVTGNIRADGNITVGDANTDNITINADVNSNIIPDADITYQLGNGGTGYVADTEFTLGDVVVTVSGSGTIVTLSIPAAGPTWVDTLTDNDIGKSYQLAIDGTPGSYSVTTSGVWSGTNPQVVSTTNDGLLDGTYNVSSIRFDQKRWVDVWVKNLYTDAIVTGDITVDSINLNLVQGKIYYVSTNGSDTNAGQHQNDPFASVKHALSIATADDTVYIYPGTYTEQFPLTVPTGVVVKGTGIRSVKIVPTTATRYNDAFLLNGETTVEDVTIADYFSGGNYFAVTSAGVGETVMNVGTAPFAHTWVSSGTINISGTAYSIIAAVYSHTTGVLTVNHVGPDATSASPVFLSGLIFSCNGGNRVFPDNGYAFRFATDFAVSSRSPYIRNITVLTKGSVTSLSDPLGYDAGDAGKGAYIDGAYATSVSKEASMLFHSATFICPGVDVIVATNGARVEWLNSFTYYANRSMYLYSSADGFASDGKTRVKIVNTTGTWAVGNTLSYYDTDGTTVLASGIIESIDGDFYNIDTRVLGFEQIQDRAGKTITVHGNAKLSTSVKKFGTASLALDGTGDYLSVASQPDFAFPSTISRIAKTITANGNAAVSATESKFGGSSIAFDGTGDYLSIATDTDYGFGTGDFTIEGWFYKTVVATQYLFDTRTTLNENSIAVQSNGSGSLRLFVNGAFVLTSSNAHTNNAWNHLAICRAGGVTRFFINGVVSTTTHTDATNYGTTKPLVVGAQYNGTTAFAGYIDDFRVSNTARYTATFTPSAVVFTNDVNTKLLVHGDTDISDDVGGTITSFTIESWIYNTGGQSAVQVIFDFRTATPQAAPFLNIQAGGSLLYFVNGVSAISGGTIALNTWTHVAVARNGTSTKLFVNGTQVGSTYTDITNYIQCPLVIGARFDGTLGFNGYIDDVRISKGVARYTTTFPVPTAQLTGDLSTVLLITCNGTNNSTAIADNGITLQDLRTSAGGTASIIDFADYSDFGVEVRSIGSAAVYGNYGIYGDGPGVIAYLIGQNLAYIGNGKDTTNDPLTVIQANEVVELDGAKIFYNSVDHKGDFRIGDLFYVNQATGEVSFTNSNVTIGTSLTFDDGSGNITYLDATKIETGDFRISGNTIQTLTQDFNVDAASNQINLQSNVTVTGNLEVTGDVTVGGNVTIGNESTDVVRFVAGVDSDILPALDSQYDLGTSTERWSTLYSTTLVNADIQISTNVITTTNSNLDLTLQANGTGRIYVPSNNVEITNNLTVNGTTNLATTNIGVVGTPATVTHVGGVTQTGDLFQTGNTEITGTLTVGSTAQFEDIQIDNNIITTTLGNNDLVLEAAGTGKVIVPVDNAEVTGTLTVVGTTSTTTINNTGTVTSGIFSTGNIRITTNNITTTVADTDLVLEASGTGRIYVPLNDVTLGKTLTVTGLTTLVDTDITGTLTHIGATTRTGDVTQTGSYTLNGNLTVSNIAQFKDVNITNNVITTTLTNSNLQLGAAGTGIISVPTNNVTIDNNLTVTGTTFTANINNSGTVTAGTFSTGNISINGNTIQTTVGSSNLQLQAAGTGYIVLEQFDVQENEIRINTGSDMVLTPNGIGIVTVNSTQSIKLPVGNTAARPTGAAGMVRFNSQLTRYEGYDGTNWIRLDGVEDADGNTKITAELTPGANDNTIRFYTNNTQVADLTSTRLNVINVDVDVININNNVISTTTTDTNLVLAPNGTGSLRTGNFSINGSTVTNTVNNSITYFNQTGDGYVKINSTGGFVIPAGLTTQRPPLFDVGMMRYNTDPGNFRVEVWDGGNWVNAGQAAGGGVTLAEAQDIGIVSAIIFG